MLRPKGRHRVTPAQVRALAAAADHWQARALTAEAQREEYQRERDVHAGALADYREEAELFGGRHRDCDAQLLALRQENANLRPISVRAPADFGRAKDRAEEATLTIPMSDLWADAGLTAAGVPQMHLRGAA